MSHQDWNTVILNGKRNKAVKHKNKAENKKRQNAPGTKLFRKLDEGEIVAIEKVGRERGTELAQARNVKKLKQKDVANRLSLKQSIINDWETGKAPFSKGLYRKLRRLYGLETFKKKSPKKKDTKEKK